MRVSPSHCGCQMLLRPPYVGSAGGRGIAAEFLLYWRPLHASYGRSIMDPSCFLSPTFLLGWPQTFQAQEGSEEDLGRKRLCFIPKCLRNSLERGCDNHGKETSLPHEESWSGAEGRVLPWSPGLGRAGRGHVTLSVPFCDGENKCGPLLQVENFVTLDVTCCLAVESERSPSTSAHRPVPGSQLLSETLS